MKKKEKKKILDSLFRIDGLHIFVWHCQQNWSIYFFSIAFVVGSLVHVLGLGHGRFGYTSTYYSTGYSRFFFRNNFWYHRNLLWLLCINRAKQPSCRAGGNHISIRWCISFSGREKKDKKHNYRFSILIIFWFLFHRRTDSMHCCYLCIVLSFLLLLLFAFDWGTYKKNIFSTRVRHYIADS